MSDDESSITSSESDGNESDVEDTSDLASVTSLAFSVKPGKSRATLKSKKTKKRVRFRPGDSLVLVYIIPNREMLGLKSGSDDSSEYGDSEDSDDEDGDDDDDDKDEEEEEDDDDDDDEEDDDDDDEDDDDDDDDDEKENKKKRPTQKPFAKLLSVKHVSRRKPPDIRNNVKKAKEISNKVQTTFDLSVPLPQRLKKRNRERPKLERNEKTKPHKKEINFNNATDNKGKTTRAKRYTKKRGSVPKSESDGKPHKPRRHRARLLEIRATVESDNVKETNNTSMQKVSKCDSKPSVIDVNSAMTTSSKQLVNRTRLQPTSFRISKPDVRPGSGNATTSKSITELPRAKRTSVAQVVSASYESLTSVLPETYVRFQAFSNGNVEEETIKRLDPDLMNATSKRNYAWQIANGTITSQSLRTPSILPFWDSLQNSVSESNTIKLPT